MSFLRGTSSEVVYSSIATGTQLNTFTTEDNLQKTLPLCVIPALFWYDAGDAGRGLKVKAWGRLGSTGAPTFTWTLRFLTSQTWSAAGIGFSTAALTAGTTQTLAPWELEIDITLRAMGVAAASTIIVMGKVSSPLGLASPFGGTIPTNNTAITATTFDTTVTQYLFLSAACGTSNAANLIQLEYLEVWGKN
jgi:hypothetical protein